MKPNAINDKHAVIQQRQKEVTERGKTAKNRLTCYILKLFVDWLMLFNRSDSKIRRHINYSESSTCVAFLLCKCGHETHELVPDVYCMTKVEF